MYKSTGNYDQAKIVYSGDDSDLYILNTKTKTFKMHH